MVLRQNPKQCKDYIRFVIEGRGPIAKGSMECPRIACCTEGWCGDGMGDDRLAHRGRIRIGHYEQCQQIKDY